MKIKFITFIFFSITLSYDSYISFYGSGEKLSNLNPSNISLGWSKLFDSNTSYFIGSLTELHKSNKVRLTMASDFNFNRINENLFFSQKLNYFSILFPLKRYNSALGLSLAPLYRINTNLIENDFNFIAGNNQNPPYAYKTEYDFEGGPSIASLMVSSKGFSYNNFKTLFGLQINYIFGSLYSNINHSTFDIIYDETGNFQATNEINDFYTTISNYSGLGIEMQISISKNHHQIISSLNLVDEIDINYLFYDDVIPQQLELGINPDQETSYKLTAPFELNVGYSYKFNEISKIIFEYYKYNPYDSSSDFNLFNNSDAHKNRFSLGYLSSIFNNKYSISSGVYFINTENNQFVSHKNGATFGFGIYVIPNFSIDLCLEVGKNKIEFNEPLSEKYINIYLGITAADTWFK